MSETPSPRSSSDGRQLPTVPNTLPYNANNPTAIRGNSLASNNRGSNGYGPFFQEYSLLAEYNQLHQQKIPGLYVMPCAKSPLIWSGVLFIRQGLYGGGGFRFTLTIPNNYPDGECPKFVFEHPVFHPSIHPETGEVDVKSAFPRWKKNISHIWQVFLYVKRIFYKIEVKLASNLEAATLYEQDLEAFKERVNESLREAKTRLMQPPSLDDPFALRFSPWNESVHPDSRRQMINASQKQSNDIGSANPSDLGLSWMDPSETKIFCRDDTGLA